MAKLILFITSLIIWLMALLHGPSAWPGGRVVPPQAQQELAVAAESMPDAASDEDAEISLSGAPITAKPQPDASNQAPGVTGTTGQKTEAPSGGEQTAGTSQTPAVTTVPTPSPAPATPVPATQAPTIPEGQDYPGSIELPMDNF